MKFKWKIIGAALFITILCLWVWLFCARGVFDWNLIFKVDPSVASSFLIDCLLALIIGTISFKAGIKLEKETAKAEKAELQNIEKIVKQLAGEKNELIFSTRFEDELSSLADPFKNKVLFSLQKLISDNFNQLGPDVRKIKDNTYCFKIDSLRVIFSKQKNVFIIHEMVKKC
ncbi:hypothetical protein [Legionella sp. 16cNR16C]|uniref:hypothetical protein n=1 Tax=Legionella sp. 16cNR16C TaxID=2905656 RepID=UPI001E3CBE2D|nr:hypothetical protein [Legionella sp. 16cNR16C]MCE3043708.1 hypothetical protein [Legionella sp. 16cNR16C]